MIIQTSQVMKACMNMNNVIEGHSPLSWALVNYNAQIVESQIGGGVSYKLIRINKKTFLEFIMSWPDLKEREKLICALRRRQERDFFREP